MHNPTSLYSGKANHHPFTLTMQEPITKELLVENKMGIHARPAAMFVKVASQFNADIFVEKDGERINGKSIMGLMMLAAGPGSRLVIEATGSDAQDAIDAITELLESKFNEG